jgi:hypothetical protein
LKVKQVNLFSIILLSSVLHSYDERKLVSKIVVVGKLRKKSFLALETAILIVSVFLALFPYSASGATEYSWTDAIKIYKDALSVYADIRTFTNNETFPIDVTVEIKRNPSIRILEYYKLSANGTDFIVISGGKVINTKDIYYGLNPEEKLVFSVEVKPKDSAGEGETATVEVRISYPLPDADNPPTIEFVDPEDGQTLGGVYRVKVDATDDQQVSMVELSIDSGSWIDITANFDGTYYYYDWDTATVSNGSHTLDARATDNAAQTTDASQVTVTVTNVPGGTIHVESIDFRLRGSRWLDIIVTIYDDSSSPVTGATVYMNITYPDESNQPVSAMTNGNGIATYQISRPPKGTYTVTVTNVTHDTLTYDPDVNNETTDSYTVT